MNKSVGVSKVTYQAKGTLPAVLNAIEHLFTNYNPRGYGTSVETIHMESDGTYIARVSRSTSCD